MRMPISAAPTAMRRMWTATSFINTDEELMTGDIVTRQSDRSVRV